MKIIEENKYYSIKDLAKLSGKSYQNIYRLDLISNELEARGKDRILPKPQIIKNSKNWAEDQLEYILEIIKKPPKGYTKNSSFSNMNPYIKIKKKNMSLLSEIAILKKKNDQLLTEINRLNNEITKLLDV